MKKGNLRFVMVRVYKRMPIKALMVAKSRMRPSLINIPTFCRVNLLSH
jgi:hypothetical protein